MCFYKTCDYKMVHSFTILKQKKTLQNIVLRKIMKTFIANNLLLISDYAMLKFLENLVENDVRLRLICKLGFFVVVFSTKRDISSNLRLLTFSLSIFAFFCKGLLSSIAFQPSGYGL